MLPDFPELKSEISDTLFEFLRLRISYHLAESNSLQNLLHLYSFHLFQKLPKKFKQKYLHFPIVKP